MTTSCTMQENHNARSAELERWRADNFGFLTPRQNDQLKAIIKDIATCSETHL